MWVIYIVKTVSTGCAWVLDVHVWIGAGCVWIVFKSLVWSGLFAFFGGNQTKTEILVPHFPCNQTKTSANQSHAVWPCSCNQLQPVSSQTSHELLCIYFKPLVSFDLLSIVCIVQLARCLVMYSCYQHCNFQDSCRHAQCKYTPPTTHTCQHAHTW